MHIFITGAAGFIASHTTERLLKRGDRVTGIDAFDYGYDPELKEANARLLANYDNFRLVRGDIRDRPLLERIFDEDRPDVVVHLAARAGVLPSLKDPASYIDINLTGTIQILEVMRHRGMDRLVFASSSSVYGARDKGPFRETDDVSVPYSPYAATKRAGELMCATWNQLYGMHITCLRFFTVYGPRQRPEMAIHLFADRIRRGQEITMFGDGSSLRDYTFVSDIVDGVVAAVDRPLGFEIINLGNCTPNRLDDLIAAIGEAVGQQPIVRQIADQPGDVPMTFASVDKAREFLGFEPSTPLLVGLKKFVTWLNETHPV